MDCTGTKLQQLETYQLYKLLQNQRIDSQTLTAIQLEFDSRKLSTEQLARLQYNYKKAQVTWQVVLDAHNWNPVLTAFVLHRHFTHVALLQLHGKRKEASRYMLQLYIGLTCYFILTTLLLILV